MEKKHEDSEMLNILIRVTCKGVIASALAVLFILVFIYSYSLFQLVIWGFEEETVQP